MSSNEHSIQRAALVAKLKSVAGIGVVFDYERYAKDEKAFRELYASGGKVLGWHIRRVARRETAIFNEVSVTWEIRGFYGLADGEASELAFDDLIDAIGDAFRADPTLSGVFMYPHDEDQPVPELVDSGPVVFAGVLCHSARLRYKGRVVIENAARPWD